MMCYEKFIIAYHQQYQNYFTQLQSLEHQTPRVLLPRFVDYDRRKI